MPKGCRPVAGRWPCGCRPVAARWPARCRPVGGAGRCRPAAGKQKLYIMPAVSMQRHLPRLKMWWVKARQCWMAVPLAPSARFEPWSASWSSTTSAMDPTVWRAWTWMKDLRLALAIPHTTSACRLPPSRSKLIVRAIYTDPCSRQWRGTCPLQHCLSESLRSRDRLRRRSGVFQVSEWQKGHPVGKILHGPPASPFDTGLVRGLKDLWPVNP